MKWFFGVLLAVLGVNLIKAQLNTRCTTPNGETARCVSIYSCTVLYNAVTTSDPQVRQFLKASQCGYGDAPLVCCGTKAKYQKDDTTSTSDGGGGGTLLPSDRECGHQVFGDKILNGETAGLKEFPWMVLLKYRNSSGHETFSCGGTLINDRYVLTAAHCVTGKIISAVGRLVSVRLGEWNTDTEEDCAPSTKRRVCNDPPVNVNVEEAIPHAQYDDTARDRLHDVAIVRLQRSVQYSETVRPICLPTQSDQPTPVSNLLTVAGWGRTETGKFSPTKQKLDVPVVDASQCRATFRRANVNLRDSQLCAGGERDKDSCNGDSGGPLVQRRPDNDQYYIEGVVSFGAKCGTEGWPGIYTRVSSYKEWILSKMRA